MTTEIEQAFYRCPYCKNLVSTHWIVGGKGMLSEPHVALIADWVYHTECWDKLVEEHPP